MVRISAFLISILLPLFWAASSMAQSVGDCGLGGHMMSWGWAPMMFGGVMMIIFWGGIILLIVMLARWIGGSSQSGVHYAPPHATPLDILKERFAKGEIDKKEYEERKKVLSS